MCCIFTCCGWVIDLIQRFWVFAMSCCISGAVTCTLVTSSMAGIAMGYNYSLAEYIDLKETNVSVYLKRGVFDDDIADDMDWRRAGHLPVSGHLNDFNLATGADLDYASTNVPYGRRMDDSLFQSDDHHKYEGSLMKLTMKPVYDTSSPAPEFSPENPTHPVQEFNENAVPPHGLDELKNQQALINRRKSMSQRLSTARRNMGNLETTLTHDERDFPIIPAAGIYPGNFARRQMEEHIRNSLNGHEYGASARDQVPGQDIGLKYKWVDPKLPPHKQMPRDQDLYPEPVTYPPPITLRQGPLRPSRPPPPKTYPTHTNFAEASTDDNSYKIPSLQDFKSKFDQDVLRADKQETSDEEDELAQKLKQNKGSIGEEYDDEFKGLPVRKRRHILNGRKFRTIPDPATKTTKLKLQQNNLFLKLLNATEYERNNQTSDKSQDKNIDEEIDVEVNMFDKIKYLLNRFVVKSKTTKMPLKLSTLLELQTIPDSYTMSAIF